VNSGLAPAERVLGIQWVVATAVGWIIGFAVCEAVTSFLETLFVDGLIIGTFVGGAQWLVLRRHMRATAWWVVVSIVGFGVGKAIGEAVSPASGTVLSDALTGALMGATVGVAQWLVLRLRFADAWWWIPASALAWAIGWTVIAGVQRSAGTVTIIVYVVGAIGAAAAGVVTAATLIRLLRGRAA
jgi:hypothetical protein